MTIYKDPTHIITGSKGKCIYHKQAYICLTDGPHIQCRKKIDDYCVSKCPNIITCDEEIADLIYDMAVLSKIKILGSSVGACELYTTEDGKIDSKMSIFRRTFIMFKYDKKFMKILLKEARPYMDINIDTGGPEANGYMNFIRGVNDDKDFKPIKNLRVTVSPSYLLPEEYFYPRYIEKYFRRVKYDLIKTFETAIDKYIHELYYPEYTEQYIENLRRYRTWIAEDAITKN